QVRFSIPQLAVVGAQKPGMSRVNELTVGATIESSSGISACCPPTNQRMMSDMPWGALSFENTGPPPLSVSDTWRCPDWPGQSGDHLAMNVAMSPARSAQILV